MDLKLVFNAVRFPETFSQNFPPDFTYKLAVCFVVGVFQEMLLKIYLISDDYIVG